MKKIVLVYDNYEQVFDALASKLVTEFKMLQIEPIIITSNTLTEENLNDILASSKEDELIFIAYSHGFEDRLVNRGASYIKLPESLPFFYKSFFYTFSCSFGKKFGIEMEKQCPNSAFIGYDKKIFHNTFWITELSSMKARCLKPFFKDGKTTKETFDLLIEEYENLIGYYKYHENKDERLAHANLIHNRRSLVLNGNWSFKYL